MYLEELNLPFFLEQSAETKIDCKYTVASFLESADVGKSEMDRIGDVINNPKFVGTISTMLKDTASALESRGDELDKALENLNRAIKENCKKKIKAFTVPFRGVRTGFLYDYVDFVQKQCEKYIKGTKVQDILDELDGARKVRLKEKIADIYDGRLYENGKMLDSIHSFEDCISERDSIFRSLKEYKYRLGRDAANTDLDKSGKKFFYASFTKIAKGYTEMILELNTKFCAIVDSLFNWAEKQKQPEQLGAVMIAAQAYNIFADVSNFGASVILATFVMYSRNLKSTTEFFKAYSWNVSGIPSKEELGMESAEEEEFLFRGHTASLVGIADNVIKKLENFGGYSEDTLNELCNDRLVDDPYRTTCENLNKLKQRILTCAGPLKNGDLSVSEVRRECNLTDDEIEALLSVQPILDMSSFENCDYAREAVLADLKKLKDATVLVANEFDSLRGGVTFLFDKFKNRVNMENLGEFHTSEICSFFKNLSELLTTAQRAYGKALGTRIIKLTEGLRSIDNKNDYGVDLEDDEFSPSRFEIAGEEEAEESADYEKIVKGVIERKFQAFHEAEGDNQQGNNGNPPKPQVQDGGDNGSQQGNNNQQNNGNQNNNQNNQNNNQSNQNNNGEKKTGKIDVAETARNLLDKIIEQISAFMEKGSKKKNLAFIAKNKEYLLSRNYSNTSVSLLPYRGNTDYVGTMRKVFDTVKGLDDNSLKNFTEEQITNRILASINIDRVKGDNLEARVTQALKTGSKPANNVNIANGELLKQVPKMIRFCEYYYNNIVTDLQNAKKDLDSLDIFKNKTSKGDGDRTSENINVARNCVLATIRGVRTAARDRCNDYMMIISSLSKGNKQNQNTQGNNNQNNNGENQNQDNNTEQNNGNQNNQQNNSGNNQNNG